MLVIKWQPYGTHKCCPQHLKRLVAIPYHVCTGYRVKVQESTYHCHPCGFLHSECRSQGQARHCHGRSLGLCLRLGLGATALAEDLCEQPLVLEEGECVWPGS